MKMHATLTGLAVVLLAALGLVPALAPYVPFLLAGLLALGLSLALKASLTPTPAPSPAPSPAPAPPPADDVVAEAAAVTLLGILQEKGRFIDFLMDDITPYSDAQVGAAARVVHQGCAAALKAHIPVVPVSGEAEGASLTVPANAAPDAYRLVGRIAGEPPFTGTLVHKGWQPQAVKLPRVLKPEAGRLPVIAPAQVELK